MYYVQIAYVLCMYQEMYQESVCVEEITFYPHLLVLKLCDVSDFMLWMSAMGSLVLDLPTRGDWIGQPFKHAYSTGSTFVVYFPAL